MSSLTLRSRVQRLVGGQYSSKSFFSSEMTMSDRLFIIKLKKNVLYLELEIGPNMTFLRYPFFMKCTRFLLTRLKESKLMEK